MGMSIPKRGSQHWLQVAINRHPDLVQRALQRSGAIGRQRTVTWHSPLKGDGFKEYRDQPALTLAGLRHLSGRALKDFWPARGPVWDAIGTASDGTPIFVEAKAHIPEAASPGSRATPESMLLIQRSLEEARRAYAPRASADWHRVFYQYANRLAYHYFLRELNGVQAALVFLYFTNATEMQGPASELEWKGAVRLIHSVLGIPADLKSFGVFEAFVDVSELRDR
jgi:hypothetical protein